MFLFIGSKFYVSVSNRGKGENMDKEQLIEKAIKGDKKAFLCLIESDQTKLYRTASLYTKNKEDALCSRNESNDSRRRV